MVSEEELVPCAWAVVVAVDTEPVLVGDVITLSHGSIQFLKAETLCSLTNGEILKSDVIRFHIWLILRIFF